MKNKWIKALKNKSIRLHKDHIYCLNEWLKEKKDIFGNDYALNKILELKNIFLNEIKILKRGKWLKKNAQ